MPWPRSRASSAAIAGIGEALPTAMWRTSPIRRVMTSASSSSSRNARAAGGTVSLSSRGAAGMNVLIEIARKAFRSGSAACVVGKMHEVGRVMIRQAERPAAVLCDRDRLDIEARQRAGGKDGIVEQVAVDDLLDRCHRALARMRHG